MLQTWTDQLLYQTWLAFPLAALSALYTCSLTIKYSSVHCLPFWNTFADLCIYLVLLHVLSLSPSCFLLFSPFKDVWNIKLWPPAALSHHLTLKAQCPFEPQQNPFAPMLQECCIQKGPPLQPCALKSLPINRDVNKFRQLPDLCLRLTFERHHKDLFCQCPLFCVLSYQVWVEIFNLFRSVFMENSLLCINEGYIHAYMCKLNKFGQDK